MAKTTYSVAWIDKRDKKTGTVWGSVQFAKRKDAEAFFTTVHKSREPNLLVRCETAPERVTKQLPGAPKHFAWTGAYNVKADVKTKKKRPKKTAKPKISQRKD